MGRGGATTALWDLEKADCILIMGSNMAECHPVGFRFVVKAREKGAKIIHVDPRFTRTSAMANIYAPIRAGTDIVFLGGLINYALESGKYFQEYVANYTNAAFLVSEDYQDTEELDGLFSGFDPETRTYDMASWQYQLDEHGQPLRDETLQHPRCVLQILRKHFARYSPEVVEQVCGTPQATFLQTAETICANSGRERTTAFCYAVGWTQHTTGSQMIRAGAILQLLLGNVGRPGGGLMALRGHATIQGSTDVPTLYNMLPGYMKTPMETSDPPQYKLEDFLKANYAPTGWWYNLPKYMVSLLKAWYGPNATAENGFCFNYLPKVGGDYSYTPMFLNMKDGKMRGMFVMGENFAVGGMNAKLEVEAMTKLDWCVVRDLFEIETAVFWQAEGVDPKTVPTEVFLMPAAVVAEKDGTYTNTQRLVQWHDKAVEPPGDARSETWFVYHLGQRLRQLYADSTLERDKPIQHLQWELPTSGPHAEPKVEEVVREISGYRVADHSQVGGFAELADDGTTACGCWIYSGVVSPDGRNLAASRQADPPGVDTNHQDWAFSWPNNRRILYNRASADPDGQPWSEAKKLVWWDAAIGKWTGQDTPDFPLNKAPETPANPDGKGLEAHSGRDPFLMQADGRGWLFAPKGLVDGPLPTHYEALESPVENPLYKQQINPTTKEFSRKDNRRNRSLDPRYPYVATTYRLTEHHTSGGMSRWIPWLSELQPELFAEIDPELAAEKQLKNGDWATVWTERGELELKVLVTDRMQPLKIGKRRIHQIGMPYHWGSRGLITGDVVNNLTPLLEEANVYIHEAKTFTCNLRKGRRTSPPVSSPSSSQGVVVTNGGAGQDLVEMQNKETRSKKQEEGKQT